MKDHLFVLLAFTCLAASGVRARATWITGEIVIRGTATMDGTLPQDPRAGIQHTGPPDATRFLTFTGFTVNSARDDYAGTLEASVTVQPFTFRPPDSNILNLWSFSQDGRTFSFDMTTFAESGYVAPIGPPIPTAGHGAGTGILRITGLDDTLARWDYSSYPLGAPPYNWQGPITVVIDMRATPPPPFATPDSGNTLTLLGLAGAILASLTIARR